MAEIRIEGKLIEADPNGHLGVGHLYLVYQDDNQQEFVIRGGPFNDDLSEHISMELGIPISDSEDFRPDTGPSLIERGSFVLDLNGRNPSAVWNNLLTEATKIDSAKIDYTVLGPNSNTVVVALLQQVGIEVDNLPQATNITGNLFVGQYPGVEDINDVVSVISQIDTPDYSLDDVGVDNAVQNLNVLGSGAVAYLNNKINIELGKLAGMIEGFNEDFDGNFNVVFEESAEMGLATFLKPGTKESELQSVINNLAEIAEEAKEVSENLMA